MDNEAPAPQHDPRLEALVHIVNSVENGDVGVTLFVNGCIVTGMLIGARMYLKEYARQWRGAMSDPEIAEEVERIIIDQGEESIRKLEAQESPPRNAFIHLRNARYITGHVIAPQEGGLLWRGRLSEVSGWSLGAISVTEAK